MSRDAAESFFIWSQPFQIGEYPWEWETSGPPKIRLKSIFLAVNCIYLSCSFLLAQAVKGSVVLPGKYLNFGCFHGGAASSLKTKILVENCLRNKSSTILKRYLNLRTKIQYTVYQSCPGDCIHFLSFFFQAQNIFSRYRTYLLIFLEMQVPLSPTVNCPCQLLWTESTNNVIFIPKSNNPSTPPPHII